MTTPVLERLAAAIRQEYAAARAEGRDKPGRPTLIDKLANPPEISGHLVRKAKELVDAEDANPPASPASEPRTVLDHAAQGHDADSSPAGGEPLATQDASLTPAGHQHPASRPLVLWPNTAAGRLAALNERMAAALETAEPPARQEPASEPPAVRQPAAKLWPLLLIGIAPAVIIWGGWVDLGRLTGFGPVHLLPGIWDEFVVNTAVALPISVEAYAAYAFRIWLGGAYSARTTRFARRSAVGSLLVGGLAQITYHLLIAAGFDRAPWWVTTLVACIPVAVFGLAAVLAHMARHEHQAGRQQ